MHASTENKVLGSFKVNENFFLADSKFDWVLLGGGGGGERTQSKNFQMVTPSPCEFHR